MEIPQTAERVSGRDASDNYVFQRSLLAYVYAAERVGGRVLEIGTGSGYGVERIAPHAEHFLIGKKIHVGRHREQRHDETGTLYGKGTESVEVYYPVF